MVQLSANRCSCIAILCVSLVSFAAITLCVASQRVFVIIDFVIDSVRKLLDTTPSYFWGKISRYPPVGTLGGHHTVPGHFGEENKVVDILTNILK
jgi:hypothetical protein